MSSKTKTKLTRFDPIRESERDMRCMVRDMTLRRRDREELQRLQRQKRRGHQIDEVKLSQLTTRSKRMSSEILKRWDRLHRRMNRESTRRAEIENIFSMRGEASGDGAHP